MSGGGKYLVQTTIADEQGVMREKVWMDPPGNISRLESWLHSAKKAIGYDFVKWTVFSSYAGVNNIIFELKRPDKEFRATIVIDRTQRTG